MQQTDVIPIMGEVYHTIMSLDEKFMATETFNGTLGIVDVSTKQMIAKKQKCKINGSFIFSGENKLLYFFEDAIRYWDFIENKDEVIWKVPEEWKLSGDDKKTIYVVCNNVLYNGGGYFPITMLDFNYPHRVFLSPDEKWILLDYFDEVILMKHENYEIKYCLFSYTGKTALHMGFVDSSHFWYTWGDTTYIQEIVDN